MEILGSADDLPTLKKLFPLTYIYEKTKLSHFGISIQIACLILNIYAMYFLRLVLKYTYVYIVLPNILFNWMTMYNR